MFFVVVMEVKKGSKIEKYLFCFIILFSAPVLFLFERANIVFVALIFLMIFSFFKDNKNSIIREIAIISLAISIGIKLYPVLFALLLIKEKRFKDVIRLAVYLAVVFILPLFAIGGLSQITLVFKNIYNTSDIHLEWGVGYSVNILNITRSFFAILGNFGNSPIILGKLFSFVILFLGLFSIFVSRSKWKTVAFLTLLMILVPSISYEYVLIFMIIPLIMFLDREGVAAPIDYLYLTCFVMIFIPFTLNKIDFINSGFGVRARPLTYGLLIQNFATLSLLILLLIDLFIEKKKDFFKHG